MRERIVKLRVISTVAGTIKVAQATPRIIPVMNREVKVFSQMPKMVSDQSTLIGISERKSQIREIGSTSSTRRHNG